MSRETAPAPEQAQSLLRRLVDTAAKVEPDDLSSLAQMHGWCETLVDLAKQDATAVDAMLKSRVGQIARQLEALILGEAEDAAKTLAAVTGSVLEIVGTCPAGEVEASQPAELSDDLLNKKLDEVFAEAWANEETTEQSAALPEAEPEPVPEPVQPPAAPPTPQHKADPVVEAPSYVAEPLILDAKEFDFIKGFVEEAKEHIELIELAVLEVERAPADTAKIDDLFRPFHTIKGMAGFLNLRDINCLTHEAETLLDQGRKGKRAITPGIIDLVLSMVDVLKAQIGGVGQWVMNPNANAVSQPPVAQMIDRLRGVVAGRINVDDAPARSAAAAAPQADAPTTDSAPAAEKKAAPTPAGATPEAAASAPTSGPKAGDQSIRIDTEKLDALIDMVGELVIAQTLVNMSNDVAANPKLAKNVTQVTKIVRDVQEMAMAMRMVPIGPTFQKMARLVRDVSRKANRKVNLTISGEDTELDKTVIQEIGDPLVHMVRNAVDHGVEAPDARIKAGKSDTGEVHLHAGHEGGNIVISISDDGKGLDPAVLIAKAVEKGLIEPGQELTDQQAFQLVFAPGFSTAAQVTDISGRGVGMDVVKRNIESLRGHVEITSEKGKGTTFTIRLPLTLAIIDGMVIRVGSERFIIPTISIQQSLRPRSESITTVQHRGEVLNMRGELIPLVQLGEMFGLSERINPCDSMIVIAQVDGRMIGLVVEELIGQQQVVIKSLGERFERLRGISGAAILGDGRVGLILEMLGIAAAHEHHVGRSESRRAKPTEASRNTTSERAIEVSPAQTPAALAGFQTGETR